MHYSFTNKIILLNWLFVLYKNNHAQKVIGIIEHVE